MTLYRYTSQIGPFELVTYGRDDTRAIEITRRWIAVFYARNVQRLPPGSVACAMAQDAVLYIDRSPEIERGVWSTTRTPIYARKLSQHASP